MNYFDRYPKICCIYFLFLNGKIIYIGQTVDLRTRMANHVYGYRYDCIRWITCPQDKLKHYEKRLIRILKPLANYIYNADNPNRIDISYITPRWAYHYSQMMYYNHKLNTGDYYCRITIENVIKAATSDFRKNYNLHGFKKTFLDAQ